MARPVDRDQPLSFTQIGDGLTKAMAGINRPLSKNGGEARTVFSLTIQNLRDRCRPLQVGAADVERIVANAECQFEKGLMLCESPIECMVLAALINADWFGFGALPPVVHDAKTDPLFPVDDIVIIPQFAFARYRMDFGIYCRRGDHTRVAAVECDGREFHPNTTKDRNRDAYLQSWGIETYRIAGREINFDVVKAVIPAVYSFADWVKELSAQRKEDIEKAVRVATPKTEAA